MFFRMFLVAPYIIYFFLVNAQFDPLFYIMKESTRIIHIIVRTVLVIIGTLEMFRMFPIFLSIALICWFRLLSCISMLCKNIKFKYFFCLERRDICFWTIKALYDVEFSMGKFDVICNDVNWNFNNGVL
jgi:hypothetical protein